MDSARPSADYRGRGKRPPRFFLLRAAIVVLLIVGSGCDRDAEDIEPMSDALMYRQASSTHESGTGRFYMGREIAQVAGSERMDWLERPEREMQELPDRVVRALGLRPNDVVADIGAGTGYFTFRISPRVPDGRVLAVDIDQEMLDLIRNRADRRGVNNVEPILGTVMDPRLPEDSVDLVLIVFTYTQLSHPHEMMSHIREALRPGGRLVLVEYRAEDPTIPAAPVYRISEEQAIREIESIGLLWRETRDILPQHHFMVFEKPAS